MYFGALGLGGQNFTAHSSRAGCATTLLMLGVSKEKVKAHARWATDQMVKHYTRLDEVLAQTDC
jgi:integrase